MGKIHGDIRFFVLFLLILCIVVPVAAQTFQDLTSTTLQEQFNDTAWSASTDWSASMSYSDSTVGGNDDMVTTFYYGYSSVSQYGYSTAGYSSPSATTYAAATAVSTTGTGPFGWSYGQVISVLDVNKNNLYTYAGQSWHPAAESRLEVKVSGGYIYIYDDGTYVTNSTYISTPAYYVRFGTGIWGHNWATAWTYWDDYVYGQNSNMYSFDAPSNGYCIRKDLFNSALDGLVFCENMTIVNTNLMFGRYGKASTASGQTSGTCANETVALQNYDTGVTYATHYTGANCAEQWNWDIKTAIIDSGAPNGMYVTTIPGSGAVSERVPYITGGATVAWDQDAYTSGDAGIITGTVTGDYWSDLYSYKIAVMDIYGTFHGTNTTMTSSTQIATHPWSEDDAQGVYYALLIATDEATGVEYILGMDWAELTHEVVFTGWVNNAETEAVIAGANVSFNQGVTTVLTQSAADGNYTAAGGFVSGSLTYVNATAAGFHQYLYNFTPLSAKTISLNISLVPDNPTTIGVGIGGVVRDTTYGRPIEDALVYVVNTTNSQYFTRNTSMTGWYLCDWGSSCYLESHRQYDVWGEKTGYNNSVTYSVVTA